MVMVISHRFPLNHGGFPEPFSAIGWHPQVAPPAGRTAASAGCAAGTAFQSPPIVEKTHV